MTIASNDEPASVEQALSPYLAARRTWNDHVARIVAARTLWQAVALVSLMIAAAAVSGLLVLSTRSRFIPYVIEVDRAGLVQAVARADRMPPPTRAVIEAQLEKFVTLSRRVTTDVALQRSAIFGVFAMLTPDDAATVKMTDYLNGSEERTPFNRAKTETVTTE
ncbi:MAG TPA: VirB8/TrbF family protein, partial [Polyangiaceae bacterium]|nr:VirB8/TrbF family protein [Polyangiaceae bacterium]